MDSFRFRVRLELESEEESPVEGGTTLVAVEAGTRLSEPPDSPSWNIGNDIGSAVVRLNGCDWHSSLRVTLEAFSYVVDMTEGLDYANPPRTGRSDREIAALNAIKEAIENFEKFLDLVDPPTDDDDDDAK